MRSGGGGRLKGLEKWAQAHGRMVDEKGGRGGRVRDGQYMSPDGRGVTRRGRSAPQVTIVRSRSCINLTIFPVCTCQHSTL